MGRTSERNRTGLAAAIAALFGAGSGAFGGGSALAQEQAQQEAGPIEEITVTGSRITRTSGFTTAVPVTTLTRDELFDLDPGNTLSAQLDALPQFLDTRTPQNAGPGGGSSIVGSPVAGLNLRRLGQNRTLVLLDGSRVVPTDKQGTVNVDLFPSALVQSVDVVTGGASAAYGADALGGVVNFVLDRQFEGLRANMSFGQHEGGVGQSRQLEIAGGTALLDGRLHVIGSLESREVDEVPADWTRLDNFKFWGHIRNPDWFPGAPAGVPLRLTRPWVMSARTAPTGVINAGGTPLHNMRFTVDGSAITPFEFGEGACQGGAGCLLSMSGEPGEPLTEMRKQGWTRTIGPRGNEAISRSAFLGLQYELTDRLSIYGQGMWGRTETNKTQNLRFYPFLEFAWTPTIFADNAFLPEEVRQVMEENGIPSFQLRKGGSLSPFQDVGSNEKGRDEFTNTTFKLGIDYTIPGVEWNLNAFWQRGESERESRLLNMLRADRLYLGTDAVVHPDTGEIVCRVQLFNPTREQLAASVEGQASSRPLNPYLPPGEPGNTQPLPAPVGLDGTIEDCVPVNLFGSGNLSQEALDYLGTDKADLGDVDQDFAEVLLNGALHEGWGIGPVSFALGFTWRDQDFIQGGAPEELDVLGPPINVPELGIRGIPRGVQGGSGSLHAQSHTPFIAGQMDVWEWFTEVAVPVFESGAFSHTQRLDANLAYRASDYNRSGTVESWKLGLDFQVLDDLRLRMTRSRDVREPTFFELFDAQAQLGTATDPRFDDESFAFSQVEGGNRDLRPEKANTEVVGVVWQPSFASGLQLSLDWYRVEVEDSVELLGVQNIIDGCELDGVAQLCNQVVRDPGSGQIIRVFNVFLNVAEAAAEGVDMEVQYRTEPDWSASQSESLSLRWLAGYLKENSTTPFDGTPTDFAGGFGFPDFNSVMTATYRIGPFSFQLQGRYIDSVKRNVNWVEGVDVDDNKIGSMTWWNARFGYSRERDNGHTYGVSFNVQNVLDRPPPVIPNFNPLVGSSQTVTPLYDIFGRRYNLRLNYRF